MEPKFQSSFIPKGPVSTAGMMPTGRPARRGGLYGYIAMIIFSISLIAAVGVFGYRFYVKGTINKMSLEITERKDTLIPGTAREFIRINNRIKATQDLINDHVVVSPLFDYLENSTVKSVRFTELSYSTTPSGVILVMKGEATGYAALALQSDIFNRGSSFKETNFSDLSLDSRGNVTFALETKIDPGLISYQKQIANQTPTSVSPATTAPATTTSAVSTTTPGTPSTSSGQAATSSSVTN